MFGFFKRKQQQDRPGKPEEQENELLTEEESPPAADGAHAEEGDAQTAADRDEAVTPPAEPTAAPDA
ncbi:hypothetical protein C1H66_01810, partial [Halomonas heilongjiangensis]